TDVGCASVEVALELGQSRSGSGGGVAAILRSLHEAAGNAGFRLDIQGSDDQIERRTAHSDLAILRVGQTANLIFGACNDAGFSNRTERSRQTVVNLAAAVGEFFVGEEIFHADAGIDRPVSVDVAVRV